MYVKVSSRDPLNKQKGQQRGRMSDGDRGGRKVVGRKAEQIMIQRTSLDMLMAAAIGKVNVPVFKDIT